MSERSILVLREGTEGLSTEPYADALRERLPDVEVLRARTPGEEREFIVDAAVVTGVGIDGGLLGRAERLELFACAFSGTEHLPLDELADRDVAVTNASGIHAPGIAEQVVANLLVFARRLDEGWRRKRRREWRYFQSGEFKGSTVTVVGLGSIGEAVVQRLAGFDVETIGARYTPEKGGPTDEVIGFETEAIHDALARSDAVVLACPLTDETRGLLGAEEFATMSPDCVVVNVARGGLVETDALVEALKRESIGGAALDVTDPEPLPESHPLWTLENCHLTPHTGGYTPEHWPRLADIVAENVRALESGAPVSELRNVVLDPTA